MSNLINSAMSGLGAAQAALNTTSNNLASYNVAGYSRQTTVLSSSNSTLGPGGWVGNGVYVSNVQREYDSFITNQLRTAQTQSSGLTTRYEQMSKIDNMFSSTTNNLSTRMQEFFGSLQTLVSNADDPAARQTLLGKADGLVNQFKSVDQYLRDQDKQVNLSITSTVDQINNYSQQIANLNDKISRLTGVGAGASPNALLDQRDQLVGELNKLVGVDVNVQDGTYNVSMANGDALVTGKNAHQLAAVQSDADPSRMTIAYVDKIAGNIEIPEKLITTGSLGGMLTFRSQDLDQARADLNQMAFDFADAFNEIHRQGVDLNGESNALDFFDLGNSSANDTSDTIVNLRVNITDGAQIALGMDDEDNGESDNRNGQSLLDLQDTNIVGGNKTFNDAYASLVSTIGTTTATLKSSNETQGNVVTQLSNQQQSISGVNLDEEYGNLQLYQQYYLANAQVLQTASTIFDALINIR